MKYSSHIGAVVVENVRIYHDLGYILGICEYLQHKFLECLRRRAKPTDAFAADYYCLPVSTTYFLWSYGTLDIFCNFPNFGVAECIAYLKDL